MAIIMLFGSQVMAQLVISPESSMTILNGTSLYIGTNLFIKSDAAGSGHLADQNIAGNVIITGDISIERYLTADGWHNISAPLNNISSSAYSSTDLLFYYDETIILNDWNFGWVWYDGPMDVMRGYDIFSPSTLTTTYYSSSETNLNTGTFSHSITRTNPPNGEVENRKGWNLLGNPYPSPVDWLQESGWDKSDINDAKYIWNPDNNNYTIFIGGGSPIGTNGATQYIPSNQGFWVQAMQNGSVQINNSCRFGVAGSTPGYYKTGNTDNTELRLLAVGNGYSDESIIRFIPESSIGFDINLDASKLFSPHDSVPQINTKTDGESLAINTLPELYDGLVVNLDFSCNTSGNFSISIEDDSSVDSWVRIYLLDKIMDNITEITNGRDYSFQHNPLNPKNRFAVYFNPSEDIIKNDYADNPFSVMTNKNTITVVRKSNELEEGIINVYNPLGQIITTQQLENTPSSSFTLNSQSGYYIVNIIIGNQSYNYKIRIIE